VENKLCEMQFSILAFYCRLTVTSPHPAIPLFHHLCVGIINTAHILSQRQQQKQQEIMVWSSDKQQQ